MGGINTEEARSACESWLRHLQESVVVTVPSKDLLADAILVSLAIGHTPQDCLCVALAQREQAPLITNDRKLQERAARVGIAVNEPGHWEIN